MEFDMTPLAHTDLNDEEKLILYSLGALDNTPLRSKVKIQKLLFLVSNVFKGFQGLLKFEPHLLGPYSETVNDVLESLMKLELVEQKGARYQLSEEGLHIFNALDPKPDLVSVIEDFKAFLHDLSDEEVLTFIYVTYPDYISESIKWEELKPQRLDLAISLLKKKKVSFSKAAEVAGQDPIQFDETLCDRGIRWRS